MYDLGDGDGGRAGVGAGVGKGVGGRQWWRRVGNPDDIPLTSSVAILFNIWDLFNNRKLQT